MTRFARLAALLSTTMLVGPALAQETHPETGDPLAEDQTLIIRLLDEPSSFDPQVVEDVDGSHIVRQMFEGLMNQAEDGSLVPGVATGFEVNEDNTVYTFTLRDDATWSNGEPVTAEDFVYAWRRAASPELASPYQWFVELMSLENASEIIAGDTPPEELGVEAIDERTLEVRLSQPLPYFAQMTTHSTTFPAPQSVIEEHRGEWTRPENMVSNGAFVLEEHAPNERTTVVKNDEYWDAEDTILERVTFLVINDENVALTRYLSGELDRTDIPSGQYPRLEEEYPEEAIAVPELCNYYYTFNLSDTGPEAFKDPNVRKALSLAVDRQVITDNILAAGQPEAYTFTPAAVADFEPPEVEASEMSQAERDELASELMEEAGYGPDNPLRFDMLYNTDESHNKIAVALSQMWKQKLGVEASLANMEWKTFLETRDNQNFELARGAWCGDYNEASTFLDLLTTQSGYNDGKFSNERVDTLMQEAKTAENPEEKYTQVEQIVAEEVPVIPLYFYTGDYMLDTDVANWPLENVEQNWYAKDIYKTPESDS